MLNAILSTLSIMGWLGIILGILVVTNTLSGTLYNIYEKKEKFSLKKLFKGLGKALIFYISSSLLSVAFTMLPYINEMITDYQLKRDEVKDSDSENKKFMLAVYNYGLEALETLRRKIFYEH